ncbi:branched-chain amino acid ABC transporter permease/ATP-binding protein [Streptomyces sp. WM6386]|uniref:branched-chain amino acid ABC transporter permease/ATP-binding protein n=1 Tax=Streptomyces sp. WM6386 TaxID=1415558 RepID=UPI0006196E20|nr:branched-chain amino acid ABC transporter permease/ATP-binding protein [Streptomyces sp. WM6386]KKD06678.1 ABC transporter [Streptomyces sp. WM6386]
MNDFIQFAVLGLGVGGVYAIAAQGLVLTYRGSGVLNLAHGAMALLGAALYTELHEDQGAPLLVSFAIPIAVCALLGLLIYFGVMRLLRRASPLARLVATLGVLGVLQASSGLRYGTEIEFVAPILPSHTWEPWGGVKVGSDRIYLLLIAAGVTVLLWAVYRFTAFGRSTSAVAENERSAAALGVSSDVVAAANWALGGALAAVAGVLVVPITGFAPGTLALLIVPVLASAMIGSFASFPLTLLGGAVIGVAQSLMGRYVHTTGWADSAPFLVIIALLALRGRALPLRGFLTDRLPRVGTGRIAAGPVVTGLVVVSALILLLPVNGVNALTTTFVVAVIALSVVVVTGYAGQVSLAQYAFAGIGAFVSARLAQTQGLPFWAAFVAGVVAAVPVGLLFALPALRTRGVNLAVATLGLALAVERLVLGNKDYTGGFAGTVVKPPALFGFSLDSTAHPERYAFLCLTLFAVAALLVANLRRGRAGRRLLATRANERAAASLGIGTVGAKLYAFALAGAIAAAAGVLLAFRYPNVGFTGYSVFDSMNIVVLTFLGGVGYIGGALLAGGLAVGGALTELVMNLIDLNKYATLATSVALILIVINDPNGMAFRLTRIASALRELLPDRWRGTDVTEPVDVAETGASPTRSTPRQLVVDNLTVRFGGVVALNGVGLTVRPGEIVGLIGPNGAGKTTLIDSVTGFCRTSEGRITLDGEDVGSLSARRRALAGLGRSFQNLELFEDMTVADNLRSACDERDAFAYVSGLFLSRRRPLPPLAQRVARDFELADDLHRLPGELSYGRRRLLAIARAVARHPSILLLDEPAAGLDEHETAELGGLLRRIAEEWGTGILLVEHDMGLVMSLCDRLIVLDFGTLLMEGPPDDVREDERVRAAYLGRARDRADDEEPASMEEPKAEVKP